MYDASKRLLIKEKIKSLVKEIALSRARTSVGDEVEIEEDFTSLEVGQVLKNHMALIMIHGCAFRITLKLHFSLSQIQQICHHYYGLSSSGEVTEHQTIDFVKELSNMIGGAVAVVLDDVGIDTGISLPLCMSGFYEVFSDYRELDTPYVKFNDIWKLHTEVVQIYGTAQIEIRDEELAEKLLYMDNPSETDDEGGIDFL